MSEVEVMLACGLGEVLTEAIPACGLGARRAAGGNVGLPAGFGIDGGNVGLQGTDQGDAGDREDAIL